MHIFQNASHTLYKPTVKTLIRHHILYRFALFAFITWRCVWEWYNVWVQWNRYTTSSLQVCCFVLFDLFHYVPTTIFQLNRDWSSWVEPVLS